MKHPAIALIERRSSANHFDPDHVLADAHIEELARLAARAPTAYNLQNWRMIAVRTPQAKQRLRELACNQAKVAEAAVTFVVCGQLPDHATLPERLGAFVAAGHMSQETAAGWQQDARTTYARPQAARDEAVRSATLGAATLIHAAEAMGMATGPMVGFDAEGVARQFGIGPGEWPVMLVAVGRPAPGNWPQKPRRALGQMLSFA